MFDEIWFACMALKWLGKGIKAVRCSATREPVLTSPARYNASMT
jgi:hypothetical protein